MAAFSFWKRPARPKKEAQGAMHYRQLAYDQVDSTNRCVKEAIDAGQAEGLVVRAASQTAGYGRQGRVWASPRGGLYLSVLLRPTVRLAILPSLSLVAAVAVKRALQELLPAEALARVRIKWPNDIILEPAPVTGLGEGAAGVRAPLSAPPGFAAPRRIEKLCGISLEAYRGALCLGVGVNVVCGEPAAPVEGKNSPVYLADLGFSGEVDEVAEAFLKQFSLAYAQWQEEGLAAFASEFEACMAFRGEVVEVRDIAGKVHARGVLQGIDEGGGLLIEQDGVQSCISSGELHPTL